MTPQEFANKFNQFNQNAKVFLQNSAALIANDSIAKVADRIQNTGKDASGAPLLRSDGSDYSTAYKQLKSDAGRYQGFVDLSFSRRMWTNLQYRETVPNGNGFKAVVRTDNPEDLNKVEENTLRYGEFLKLSPNEEQEVSENVEFELRQIFENTFND